MPQAKQTRKPARAGATTDAAAPTTQDPRDVALRGMDYEQGRQALAPVQMAGQGKPAAAAQASPAAQVDNAVQLYVEREAKLALLHGHYLTLLKSLDELSAAVNGDLDQAEWQSFFSSEAMNAFARFGALGGLFDPSATPAARVAGLTRLAAAETTGAAGMSAEGTTALNALTLVSPADVQLLTSSAGTLDKAQGLVGWAFTVQSTIGAWKVQAQKRQIASIKADAQAILGRRAEVIKELGKIGRQRAELNTAIKTLRGVASRLRKRDGR